MKIVLCGFMGCGKSSIGRRLAKRLGYKFADMDRFIEAREGMKIAEIFETKGEDTFRAAETSAIESIMAEDNIVVAAGGGTVLRQENIDEFHRCGGKIYFLDVPVAALKERLKNDRNRPLLQRPDRREFIDKLHRERYPKYVSAADIVVDAAGPAVYIARKMAEMLAEEI